MNKGDDFLRSPYLEDHESDPVNWNTWSDKVFELSKKEDKPLFITIGYSTCHWCHVMQAESFRDDEVARLLNDNYIPVVVDREERPDIDSFYMEVSQIMNGNGGWPLNVIAMPDGRPFQVFTYLPPRDAQGSGGLVGILSAISEIWKNERGRIVDAADQVTSIVLSPDKTIGGEIRMEDAVETLQNMYDRKNGGFGDQPKFPNFPYMIFLMNYMHSMKNRNLAYIIEKTLKNIRNGGIYDQIGYGLHRYSTDSEWKVPHFEKMLYDQSMAILAYTLFYRFTGNTSFLDVAGEVVEFVNREMKNADGFYVSGIDSDFNGIEGGYYTWTDEEIDGKFGEDDRKQIKESYYFDRDADNRIIFRRRETFNVAVDKIGKLRELNKKIRKIREERGNPRKDDKAILSWNCMLLSAMIQYSNSSACNLKEEIETVRKVMRDFSEKRVLYRTVRKGRKGVQGLLEDYSYYSMLMVDAFEATGETEFLSEAVEKVAVAREKFLDHKDGGFFSNENNNGRSPIRRKDRLDIIYPSGESVLFLVLEKLYLITGAEEYREMSESILHSRKNDVLRNPLSSVFLLYVLLFRGRMKKIELPGKRKSEYLIELGKNFLPEIVVVPGSDVIQICDENSCKLHGENFEEALKYLQSNN